MRAKPDNVGTEDRPLAEQHDATVLPFVTRAELDERATRAKRPRHSTAPCGADDDDPGPPAA